MLRTAPQSLCEVLIFEVEGQRHGVLASAVREVLRAVALVPLPDAHGNIEGLIDLRGRVVPVVDMRQRLGLPSRPVSTADFLIVVESSGRLAALRADRVSGLASVEVDALPLPDGSSLSAPSTEMPCRTVGKHPEGLVPLHSLEDLVRGAPVWARPAPTVSLRQEGPP